MTKFLPALLVFLFLIFDGVNAFSVVRPAVVSARTSPASSRTTSLNVFGKRKPTAAEQEKLDKYWQGEWVCKDCGYIYNRVRIRLQHMC